jgi:soluble lytic murein transglycosylase-like protein
MAAAPSIDRIRLAILMACAVLASTLGAFEEATIEPTSQAPLLPPVSSPAPANLGGPSDIAAAPRSHATSKALPTTTQPTHTSAAGEELFSAILRRLSNRHTGLPERERIALVRTILAEARLYDLDPGLIVAVIEVESAGYHLAVSHVGALGLMQLLPATGKELAMRLGIEWHGDDTLFDPIINVRLGTAYLSQLHKRYGNVHTALAAYNWGPGRIDRRIRRGANVPTGYPTKVMRAFDRNSVAVVSRS